MEKQRLRWFEGEREGEKTKPKPYSFMTNRKKVANEEEDHTMMEGMHV